MDDIPTEVRADQLVKGLVARDREHALEIIAEMDAAEQNADMLIFYDNPEMGRLAFPDMIDERTYGQRR